MKTWRRRTGDRWEARALAFLRGRGLNLVERNFNTRYGELDLVMRDGEALVFVEVRYRRAHGFGGAVPSVTHSKRQRLVRTASLYLQARPALAELPCRFDVLAFDGADEAAQCHWIRNAFPAF